MSRSTTGASPRSATGSRAASASRPRGLLVVPGLIDLHVHVYDGVSHYGIDADTYLLRRGTTTGVDVGSAGAQTFPGLRRLVVERAQTRVYAYLHIAVEGMISALVGELEDLRWASVEQCVRVAEANRDVIAGVKLRAGYQMVGPDPRPALGARARGRRCARAAADGARDRHGDAAARAARAAAARRRRDALLPRQRRRPARRGRRGVARGLRRARARHPLRRRARRRLVHVARGARGARAGLPARHDLERHPRPQPRGPGARPAAHALQAAAPRHAADRRDRRRDRARRRRTSRTSPRPASARSRPAPPATSACSSGSAAASRSSTASTACRRASPNTRTSAWSRAAVVRAGAVVACDEPA